MDAEVKFRIDEMDCAEEVRILKDALWKEAGVSDLGFDILNRRLTILYEPSKTGPESLKRSIDSTGMTAVPWEKRSERERVTLWQRQGRLLTASASGVLLLAGFISHYILHGGLLHALSAGYGDGHSLQVVSIILYFGSIIGGIWFVAPRALSAARRLQPDMHFLMTLAVTGAVIIGEWPEAAMVSFLFAVSLLLEHWSVERARRSIQKLLSISPPTARLVDPASGTATEVPVGEVAVGRKVIVRPGERISLDGWVTEGRSSVNQAPITGESIPVSKETGQEVFAGTINGDGVLEIEVSKEVGDTTLARIIHLVQEAHSRRVPSEQWVERFARWYTPVMIVLATAIVAGPPLLLGQSWSTWFYRGLVILLIGCPCALVISTPVSIVSGLTSAARNGVLIKGGVFLEAAGQIKAVALDKTGTLTVGRPEARQIIPLNGHTAEELLERAAALEAHSEHALARAIRERAASDGITAAPAGDFQVMKGKGAEGDISDRKFWIGSHCLMEEQGAETEEVHRLTEELERTGNSVVAVGNREHVCGLITVADSPREEAREAVASLKRAGIKRVVMLTGDNRATAAAIVEQTGVDDYLAELLPEDKVKAVRSLVEETGQAAMVGDGVNDAPAMAAANIGIAMGAAGTDVAIETADIALMSDDLSKLPWLIRHSRRTLRTIKQNVAFALGLKLTFVLLAVLGIASLWMAIAADTGAALLVTANGLKLLGGGRQA